MQTEARAGGVPGSADAAGAEWVELRLAVREVDLARFDRLLAGLAARGVTFVTLAEEQQRHGDWLSRFCDLDNATRAQDPQVPRTAEQMRDRLAWLGFTPESCVLATLADRYIGYTYLDPTHSPAEGVLVQGWTGVRPEHRRQGIATALKVHGIALARRLGYAEIETSSRLRNVPSVRMNESVGFRRRVAHRQTPDRT